jgi:hypothetical protein
MTHANRTHPAYAGALQKSYLWQRDLLWPRTAFGSALPLLAEIFGIFFYGVPKRALEGTRKRKLSDLIMNFIMNFRKEEQA